MALVEDSIDHLLDEHEMEHFHQEQDDEMSPFSDIQAWKILSICLFPFIGILGISFAVVLGTRAGNKLWFTSGVMFSSGILLAGALTHSLPHANEMFEAILGDDHGNEDAHHSDDVAGEHDEEHHDRFLSEDEGHHDEEGESHSHPFPWANMIFGLTFYLLLVLEAYAERFIDNYIARNGDENGNFFHGAHGKHDHDEKEQEEGTHNDHTDQADEDGHTTADEDSLEVKGAQIKIDSHHVSMISKDSYTGRTSTRRGSSGGLASRIAPPSRMNRSESMNLEEGVLEEEAAPSTPVFSRDTSSSRWLIAAKRPSVIGFKTEDTNEIIDKEGVDEKQTINPWVAILLLIVLSVHVLLEGLTIGSAQDLSALKSTFIAIISHKLFGAFALGSSFITAGYWQPENRKMFFVLSSVYVGMDILGLGLGMALSSTFESDSYVFAILQAMLGGSFLFVAAVELIPGELEKMRVFKFPVSIVMLSLGSGYALMSLIGKWV